MPAISNNAHERAPGKSVGGIRTSNWKLRLSHIVPSSDSDYSAALHGRLPQQDRKRHPIAKIPSSTNPRVNVPVCCLMTPSNKRRKETAESAGCADQSGHAAHGIRKVLRHQLEHRAVAETDGSGHSKRSDREG